MSGLRGLWDAAKGKALGVVHDSLHEQMQAELIPIVTSALLHFTPAPADLCAAIHQGEPILKRELQAVTPDNLKFARWVVNEGIRDIGQDDYVAVLTLLATAYRGQMAGHAMVLASTLRGRVPHPCPICGQGHLAWTFDQFEAALAELRKDPAAAAAAQESP
ncbi:MAG: hypothetical protein ACYCT1_08355 [Steroidobacteraceae bacterium]